MDHLPGLKRLFVALCLFWTLPVFSAPAFWDLYMANPPVDFGSADDAASGYVNWRNSTKTCTNGCYYVLGPSTAATATKVTYRVRLFNGSGVEQTPIYVDFVPHCRVGGAVTGPTVVNGVATCPDVNCPPNKELDPDTQLCTCRSIPKAGSFMVTGDHYDGCNQGCAMVLSSGWYDKTANTTWGAWSQTGLACASGAPSVLASNDPKVEAAKQCAAGTCPGTVNGQSVCVPCDKTKQTESSSSSTSASTTASGATSSTTTTGSESGTSRTDCKDGQCTTTSTTTTIGANGDKTDKTTTTTEPQSDYCTRNPKSDVCKGTESSWGGTCSAFTCDGDAVSCAIAQASWKSACALDIEPTDSKVTAGNAALGAGDRPPGHPALNPDTSSFSANLDTSNPYGSECPTDMPLQLLGQQFEIPLSTACGSLRFMGQIAVAFALLAAAYIVFGGVKG